MCVWMATGGAGGAGVATFVFTCLHTRVIHWAGEGVMVSSLFTSMNDFFGEAKSTDLFEHSRRGEVVLVIRASPP